MAYGIAQLALASGFLAVFAAGLALQRVRERPRSDTRPLAAAAGSEGHSYETLATHSHHASATMRDSVQGFNEQLERLAELALVLMVGAMLAYAKPLPAVWWFVPLLLLVLRPLSVVASTLGERLTAPQFAMIGWFGIRGIGSVFYLLAGVAPWRRRKHRRHPRVADAVDRRRVDHRARIDRPAADAFVSRVAEAGIEPSGPQKNAQLNAVRQIAASVD